jgi:hypothetical protein
MQLNQHNSERNPMSLMPDIEGLLEADERNVHEMQRLFAGFQGLSELLNEASVLYQTCSRAFGQALNDKLNSFPRDIRPDDAVVVALLADRYRALIFARIGVFYSAAVADLLRMRLTVPLGYLRLQCESMALLKLMSEDPAITQQWAGIQSDKEGRAFFQKYQKRVMAILNTYDLSNTYDHTSGAALHSRFIGLAQGYRSRSYQDGLRVIQEDRINLQEFDPENPHRFMIEVIFTVLRTQALIFANLRDAIPEINDPLLLETRFPQFIERVNQLMDRAREHFAQYFPDGAEQ